MYRNLSIDAKVPGTSNDTPMTPTVSKLLDVSL